MSTNKDKAGYLPSERVSNFNTNKTPFLEFYGGATRPTYNCPTLLLSSTFMSVWLPRSQQACLVRSYSRQLVEPRTARYISTLRPHFNTHPVLSRSPTDAVIFYRAQSTSTSPPHASRDAASKSISSDSSVEPKPAPPATKDPATDSPLMTRVWKKVKHEAAHYWHGSKLLVSEVRISGRLQWKILHGESLTRRERRQVGASYLSRLTVSFIMIGV
jgi:hypothetical protein